MAVQVERRGVCRVQGIGCGCDRFRARRGRAAGGVRTCRCGHEEAAHYLTALPALIDAPTLEPPAPELLAIALILDEIMRQLARAAKMLVRFAPGVRARVNGISAEDARHSCSRGGQALSDRDQCAACHDGPTPPAPPAPPAPEFTPKPRQPAQGAALTKGERRVLTAIAQRSDGLERVGVTVMTGYKERTRNDYIQRLKAKGYIVEHRIGRQRLTATQAGIGALGPSYVPLPHGDALRAYWLAPGRLPAGERRCLEVVVEAWPSGVRRHVVGERAGYSERTRNDYLQRLCARELVERYGRDEVIASTHLFSGGRP